jgi:hypothetical protein
MDNSSAIELQMSIVPTCRDSMSCHGTVLDSRRQDLKMSRVLRLAALSALVLALPIVIVAQGAKGTSGAHPPGGVARAAMPAAERPFGTLREQAAMQQKWLKKRLDTFLPALMRKHGIDLWVVPMREYNEDPVFSAIAAPETFFARRRTIYVFFDKCAASGAPVTAGCLERIALGGTSQGGVFDARTSTKPVVAARGGRPAPRCGRAAARAHRVAAAGRRSVLREDDCPRVADDADDVLGQGDCARHHAHQRPRVVVASAHE